ncbi:hypothetical protein JVT61DRAFT_15217 [Boletus reticuloceps]|uniref:Ribophorin II C-terminal domain-containing protein n=1 Tax=Boletus reticuloceps TaxID=495285 RepID=A0A8I2YU33_9AGAM|nr:hypothetical protein JVT61DRAFT_15217 [Boletus reticuloceps]
MISPTSFCLSWLLIVAAHAHAASLSIQSSRFTITSSDASQLRADTLSLTQKPEPLTLGPSDVLKFTFQITETGEGNGVQPHQTFLRFYDTVSGEEGIQPVRVTPGGKAKFELNMARPPLSLPPTTDRPLAVSLILGSFITIQLHSTSLTSTSPRLPRLHLTLTKRPSTPSRPSSTRSIPSKKFPPRSSPPSLPPSCSRRGLYYSWSKVGVRVPHLLSPRILPFTALLGAFEALLVWYWVDLRLGQVLLYAGILALPTIFAGKTALATTGEWRAGKQ